MTNLIDLAKQRYWVLTLLLGAALVLLPCVTIDKDYNWVTHAPNTLWPVVIGIALLVISAFAFWFANASTRTQEAGAGLDLTRVKEVNGALSTIVSGCEIRVIGGRIEDYAAVPGLAIVLPCNEYFDDRCADDTRSALGAYVSRVFEGQAAALVSLIKEECRKRFGTGTEYQKTNEERAELWCGSLPSTHQATGKVDSDRSCLHNHTTGGRGSGIADHLPLRRYARAIRPTRGRA
jgi:hypothetical protein